MARSVGRRRSGVLQPKPKITPIRPPGPRGVFPLNRGSGPHDIPSDVFSLQQKPGTFMSGQPGGASPTAVLEALMKSQVPPEPPVGGPEFEEPEPEFPEPEPEEPGVEHPLLPPDFMQPPSNEHPFLPPDFGLNGDPVLQALMKKPKKPTGYSEY